MIRLKDIAAHAGVSVMTVSKVLRNAPDISEATKVRIKAIARQMGYVPDSNAQSLRTRTTKFLGVIISSITNPIFARVLLAIEERAHDLGYEIILAQTHDREEREEACIQRLLARRVDGLFISPVYRLRPDAPIYQALLARRVPVVILGHSAPFCRSPMWRLMTHSRVIPSPNTCWDSATGRLPFSAVRNPRPGRRNGSRAIAAPCVSLNLKCAMNSSSRRAPALKTAKKRRCSS